MFKTFCQFWQYLKEHDAPNWFAIFFSFAWPAVVAAAAFWWARRKRQYVPGFKLTLSPGQQIDIGVQLYDAVLFTFMNQTGSIVFLSRAQFKAVKKVFQFQ